MDLRGVFSELINRYAQAYDFPLTQGSWRSCSEFVALWVTLDFGALSRAGLIDHASKNIRIKNRQWLEAASGECDGTVARFFARLLS